MTVWIIFDHNGFVSAVRDSAEKAIAWIKNVDDGFVYTYEDWIVR